MMIFLCSDDGWEFIQGEQSRNRDSRIVWFWQGSSDCDIDISLWQWPKYWASFESYFEYYWWPNRWLYYGTGRSQKRTRYTNFIGPSKILWHHPKLGFLTLFLDSSKEEKRETQISFCKKCSQPIFGNPIKPKLEDFEYCTMSCLKVIFFKIWGFSDYLFADWRRCPRRNVEKRFEIGQLSNVGKESQGNFWISSKHYHCKKLC